MNTLQTRFQLQTALSASSSASLQQDTILYFSVNEGLERTWHNSRSVVIILVKAYAYFCLPSSSVITGLHVMFAYIT